MTTEAELSKYLQWTKDTQFNDGKLWRDTGVKIKLHKGDWMDQFNAGLTELDGFILVWQEGTLAEYKQRNREESEAQIAARGN